MDSEPLIETMRDPRFVFGAWHTGLKTPPCVFEARTNCRFSCGGDKCKYSSADRSALLGHEAECPARASYVEMLRKDGLALEDVDVFGNEVHGRRRRYHPNDVWVDSICNTKWPESIYQEGQRRSQARSRSRSR